MSRKRLLAAVFAISIGLALCHSVEVQAKSTDQTKSPSEQQPHSVEELRAEVMAYVKAKQFGKSHAPCEKLVDAMVSQPNKSQLEIGMELMHLGETLFRAHDDADARIAVERAIEVVQKSSGMNSDDLLQPLFTLGWIYDDMMDDVLLEPVILRQIHILQQSPSKSLLPNVMHNYAQLLRRTGRTSRALAIERDLHKQNFVPEWELKAKLKTDKTYPK